MRQLLALSRHIKHRYYSPQLLYGRLPRPPISFPGEQEEKRQNVALYGRALHPRCFSATNEDGAEKAQPKRSAREMIRLYGPVFVGTYLSVYATTLGSLFLGVQSGVLDPGYVLGMVSSDEASAKSSVEAIVEIMEHYPWTKPWAPVIERNPQWTNFGVAWVATKFTEPIRLAITIPLVPRVARYFGYGTPKN